MTDTALCYTTFVKFISKAVKSVDQDAPLAPGAGGAVQGDHQRLVLRLLCL